MIVDMMIAALWVPLTESGVALGRAGALLVKSGDLPRGGRNRLGKQFGSEIQPGELVRPGPC